MQHMQHNETEQSNNENGVPPLQWVHATRRMASVQTSTHLPSNVTAVWSQGFSLVTVHDTTAGGCGSSALFEEEKTRSTCWPMSKSAKTDGKEGVKRVNVHA